MNNHKIKINIILLVALLFSCASNSWERLDTAQSIAVVAVYTDSLIVAYKKNDKGNNVIDPEGHKAQVGLSEMAALGKGLFQKGGLTKGMEAAKNVVDERISRGTTLKNNLKTYSEKVHDIVLYAVKNSGYENRRFSNIDDDWISLVKLKRKTKKLCQIANSNIVMTVNGHVGVVKETKKMKGLGGLINLDIGAATGQANYTLIAKYTMRVADKKGNIGYKNFKINTGITKASDKGLPEFTVEDFKIIEDKLSFKMKSFLEERKLMG